jgi:hypothetical protein
MVRREPWRLTVAIHCTSRVVSVFNHGTGKSRSNACVVVVHVTHLATDNQIRDAAGF